MLMPTDALWNRAFEQRVCSDADQTEFAALLRGSTVIDAGLRDDRLAEAMDDFSAPVPFEMPLWAQEDISLDNASSEVHEELLRRADVLGSAYPFKLADGKIVYSESKSYVYEFCLAICSTRNLTRGKHKKFPRFFERVSARLLEIFLGEDALSIHTGSPRDKNVGTRFVDAMSTVGDATGEWHWAPQPPFPISPRTIGDEGMDFVAWKDSPDGREGKLFMIGQCACGNDWPKKFSDLNLNRLRKWFNPLSRVEPVRAFTTPFHLTDINLINAQTEAGMVFDRARLAVLSERTQAAPILLAYREHIKELSRLIFRFDL